MIAIQLIGLMVALAALHLTYLYYKRMYFSKIELLFWTVIWLAFLIVSLFPGIMSPLIRYLGFQRSMDLIMVAAFIILFWLTFHNYVANRKTKDKIEELTRAIALSDITKSSVQGKESQNIQAPIVE